MALLDDNTREQVKDLLSKMEDNVKFILFKGDNEYSDVTGDLLTELTEVESKIEVEILNISDPKADSYNIEKDLTPAIVLLDKDDNDNGIRFYGIPSGHEFSTLLQDIISVSTGNNVDFSEETQNKIKSIDKKMRIRVFITPTCPYCPKAVISGHQSALINDNIIGEMIEANEFGPLSAEHGVSSVPHTVIETFNGNEWEKTGEFIGAYPEQQFIDELMKTVG
jgi:glutaredoxin-like protein